MPSRRFGEALVERVPQAGSPDRRAEVRSEVPCGIERGHSSGDVRDDQPEAFVLLDDRGVAWPRSLRYRDACGVLRCPWDRPVGGSRPSREGSAIVWSGARTRTLVAEGAARPVRVLGD